MYGVLLLARTLLNQFESIPLNVHVVLRTIDFSPYFPERCLTRYLLEPYSFAVY
jgi:hypothetical protein